MARIAWVQAGIHLPSERKDCGWSGPAREQREATGLERGWDHAVGVPGAVGRRVRPAGMTLTCFKELGVGGPVMLSEVPREDPQKCGTGERIRLHPHCRGDP